LAVIVPATAVNAADASPDATLTEAGTLSSALLLESAIVTPPEPAACESVTVQLEVHPELRLVGLQDSEVRDAVDVGARSEIDAVRELPL
jgi:hypothetical protein